MMNKNLPNAICEMRKSWILNMWVYNTVGGDLPVHWSEPGIWSDIISQIYMTNEEEFKFLIEMNNNGVPTVSTYDYFEEYLDANHKPLTIGGEEYTYGYIYRTLNEEAYEEDYQEWKDKMRGFVGAINDYEDTK